MEARARRGQKKSPEDSNQVIQVGLINEDMCKSSYFVSRFKFSLLFLLLEKAHSVSNRKEINLW